ncbi:single-stranded-DNA-specific exonuclease RecJ [Heyndrickxia vini]|uniref:Single-stranded-DNA-specific exonuclease RecJ n=1 Tax=Heyndrickxia vini TaxID=1476025 RepID=A0ABX7E4U8_9BACI|nr:single-stranded-DNA-specific exonuclease RecJ [Heyndrickxia vini]QQZ10748.1 single-stranded-DNA-specific exonuclease RecJ [Heyndrickxia vini]
MLKSKTRWIVQKTDENAIEHLVKELNITPLVAALLVNRGMTEIEEARNFIFSEGEDFHDPFLLHSMEKAVKRIRQAIDEGEQILVYGDYDADGVTSTSVMITVLRDLGANVDFYIPNRFTEGYGPNEEAFRWASSIGIKLIITVDTGIAAIHEANIAEELGIDLIITDHHEPGPILPGALAIVHPNHPESIYPFKELAGVGVAFKVAHALYGRVPEHLVDLASIGTIADLVPLRGENRLIVKHGLKKLAVTERPGLQALFEITKTKQSDINEETIGFVIGPRLNAAGRLDSADPAVELLLSNEQQEALNIAKEIDEMNKERQAIVNEITNEAIEMVENDPDLKDSHVLVIGKEGWNAGVIGIVASRLVDKFYRPTIVLSYDRTTNLAKGSARSIAGFDLFRNLSTCRDILPHFGGHTMAAGMTLNIDDVGDLRLRLNELAREILTKEDFVPLTAIDAVIPLEDIHLESIQQLRLLEPYGMANPKPKVLVENVSIQQIRQIGADHKHLKVILEKSGIQLDGVGFGLGNYVQDISPLATVSVIGELAINEWNNNRKPQIFLKDIQINEWQLFDVRGNRPLKKWIKDVPDTNSFFIVFNEETISKIPNDEINGKVIHLTDLDEAGMDDMSGGNIVLLDFPPNKEKIEALIKKYNPSRIYTYFYQRQNHFFSTIPTRDHFKWFYAFLRKRGPFNVQKFGKELAAHRGWSLETIDFMSKVFFELDFVTIKNGLISLNPTTSKRDLLESTTYQEKLEKIKLENELLFSSYQDLKSWFDERMTCSEKLEEETKQWT